MEPSFDKQQLVTALNGAQNILVVCSHLPQLDQIASLLSLERILTSRNKKVTLLASDYISKPFNLIPEEESIWSKLEPRNLQVSIQYGNIPVETINYANNVGSYDVIFSPFPGELKSDQIKVSYSGLNYDLIITLGISQKKELDELLKEYQPELEERMIINLDNQERNQLYGQINIIDTTAVTQAELINHLLRNTELPVDERTATLLLTSILAKTKTMRESVSPQLLRFSAFLLNKEGNWQEALRVVNQYLEKEISPDQKREIPLSTPPVTEEKVSETAPEQQYVPPIEKEVDESLNGNDESNNIR